MSNKVLITGGTGKIGKFLVQSLVSKGFELILLSRGNEKALEAQGVRLVTGDVTNISSYSESLRGIDTVIHMAAVTHTNHPRLYYRVNTHATADLVKACKKQGVKRFIFVSTRAISEKGGDYSYSKLLAEKVVKESGLDWTILRLSEVYGAQGKEGVEMLLGLAEKLPVIPVIGNGSYKVAPVHVQDAVFAIAASLEKPEVSRNKIYNICGPENISVIELVDEIIRFKGLRKHKVFIPIWLCSFCLSVLALLFRDKVMAKDQLPRLISYKDGDFSLAKKELGFSPRSLKEDFLKKDGQS